MIWVRNGIFLENYATSEGDVFHNVLYFHNEYM